ILSKAITLRNEKGRPVRMVGNHTDVTELQKLYEELSSSSERLHIALRSSGFGTWDWDPQRDRLIWDEHMFELFGISGDSFTGRAQDCFNTIIPEDRARIEKDLYESMRAR